MSRLVAKTFFASALAIAFIAAASHSSVSATSPLVNPAPAIRGQASATTVTLADGTPFQGRLIRVSESWVEVEHQGFRLQLPWEAVRGDLLSNERWKKVDPTDRDSLMRYVEWCDTQGLKDEAAQGRRHVALMDAANNPPDEPEVVAPAKPDADKPVVDKPDTPSKPTPTPPKPPAGADRRPVSKVTLSAPRGDPLEPLFKQKLVENKIVTAPAKDADVQITLENFSMKDVKRIAWFGSIVDLTKNGSVVVKLKWKDGTTESQVLTSSDQRSFKTEAEVNQKIYTALTEAIWNHLRARMK